MFIVFDRSQLNKRLRIDDNLDTSVSFILELLSTLDSNTLTKFINHMSFELSLDILSNSDAPFELINKNIEKLFPLQLRTLIENASTPTYLLHSIVTDPSFKSHILKDNDSAYKDILTQIIKHKNITADILRIIYTEFGEVRDIFTLALFPDDLLLQKHKELTKDRYLNTEERNTLKIIETALNHRGI